MGALKIVEFSNSEDADEVALDKPPDMDLHLFAVTEYSVIWLDVYYSNFADLNFVCFFGILRVLIECYSGENRQ